MPDRLSECYRYAWKFVGVIDHTVRSEGVLVRTQPLGAFGVTAALVAAVWLQPAPAVAQDYPRAGSVAPAADDWTTPRTAWGAPDLQGVWDYRTATPLERPAEFAGKEVLTAEEAAAYERQQTARRNDYDRSPSVHAKWWLDYGTELTADNRTSLVIDPPDGRIPQTTAAAKAAAQARSDRRALTLGVEDRGVGERCLTFGVPRLPGAYNNNYQILQTPTHVAIVAEMIHAARIVPLDGRPHLAGDIRQWHGDSRGYYDGDTLVVETTNFSPKGAFRGSTEGLHLTERFTRVDPDSLHYEIVVNDPATWTSPWTAMVPMNKTEQPLFEYACHEGNRGLHNILHNARLADQAQ